LLIYKTLSAIFYVYCECYKNLLRIGSFFLLFFFCGGGGATAKHPILIYGTNSTYLHDISLGGDYDCIGQYESILDKSVKGVYGSMMGTALLPVLDTNP